MRDKCWIFLAGLMRLVIELNELNELNELHELNVLILKQAVGKQCLTRHGFVSRSRRGLLMCVVGCLVTVV